ncbi:S-formylglutathione hydrolase [Kiloniella spongiae]|uniref:S-formylglutathione hydrolase n=1 Tax=Kiloniella spongiae TaxID=1489064 RepID=A0A0H2ME63_9PROT|nr:S-formylglutathione hydrolase [Kiloniella spongiae]KLN58917.1 S-formylglutathione hydrolase [Kiloniella spongiae]
MTELNITDLDLISENKMFGGLQRVYSHPSKICNGAMRFAIYLPPAALNGSKVPVVTYLSGLTCTEDNVTVKAGAQRIASELGLIFVAPDTSPRNQNIPGEDDSYDFGSAAGFYLDATEEPWAGSYNMYSYITRELQDVISENFPAADMNRQGITGHSMGGHGALTIHLKNPDLFKTCSAFAPICAPMSCPWGEKAFSGYLGADKSRWAEYDATELVKKSTSSATLLVDQGSTDSFLVEQLKPELLQEACDKSGQKLTLRMQEGYDHSYFFMATFIEDHLKHHINDLS